MKTKILHIVQKASYNGATVYAVRLCSRLKEYNHQIISCFNGNAFDGIVASGINCENLLNTEDVSYKYLLFKYWKFFRFIYRNNYDCIHYHQGGVGILLLAYFFKKQAVIVHHLHSGNLIGDNKKENISIIHRTILKYLSNKTHQVAVAEHVFDEYSEKIKNKVNLTLIRNSTPYIFEQKKTINNAVGFIGRFTQEKGFNFLPELSVKFEKDFPELNILIIGDHPKLFKRNFDESRTNVKLFNPELNTERFYRSIDLLLFLSTAIEGMPLVVLEAISFDVGVICYPSPALKEIFGNEYPLFINSQDEIVNILSSYYEGKIDLNNLNSIHKNICIKQNEFEMLNTIRNLYVEILKGN